MKTNPPKTFPKRQLPATALVLLPLLAGLLFFGCNPSKDSPTEAPKPDSAASATPATAPLATATPAPAAPAPAAPAASDASQPATPAGLVRYDAQPVGSFATIEGTSSIHDWNMKSAVIGGFMEVDAKFPESALTDAAAARPNVQAFMPVRSFKSYAKRMDEVMQEQMNEKTQKRIEYKLVELKPKSAAGSTGALQFDAVGALTINGTTKTNTMPVTIEKKDGKIKVKGSTPIKMSDFSVKPPTLSIPLIGDIKTGDEVKVTIEWFTAPKAP